MFEGVGVSAGSFIGGYLMNEFGGSATFRLFGVVAIIFSVIHFIVQTVLDKYVDDVGKKFHISPEKYTYNGALAFDNNRTQDITSENAH